MNGKKTKIEIVFQMFDDLFNGLYEPLKFSCDMETFLFDNYQELERENPIINHILQNDVPDICSEGEPGFNPTHMVSELKTIYTKAKDIIT